MEGPLKIQQAPALDNPIQMYASAGVHIHNVVPSKIETRFSPTTRPPLTNGGFSDSAEGADD